MHAKYEVSISYGSKVIAKVKVDNRQTNRQTDKQTGQKQYAPDHSIRGHKNIHNIKQVEYGKIKCKQGIAEFWNNNTKRDISEKSILKYL